VSHIRSNQGFTFIELLITMAIAGILATMAIPTYQNYIERSRASAAGADLVTLATSLEASFQRRLAYPVMDTESTAATRAALSTWQPSADRFYEFKATVTATQFQLSAAHQTGTCTLTLGNQNQRTISGDCGGLNEW